MSDLTYPNSGYEDRASIDSVILRCPPQCKPITSINIVAIRFLSDHDLLKRYFRDWHDGGARYPKPEWTPSSQHPISHSMKKKVQIEVLLDVLPPDACPEFGDLIGEGPQGHAPLGSQAMTFTHPYTAVFEPGMRPITLESDLELQHKVQILDFQINWSIKGTSTQIAPSFTSNKMYVTYDTPYNDTPHNNSVTEKRLSWVCGLCSGNTNGHESVQLIHDSTLSYSPGSPKPTNHWDIAGGTRAECMELSKFYMLAAEMLGLRKGEVVYLYPQPGKTTNETPSSGDNERRNINKTTHSELLQNMRHSFLNVDEILLFRDKKDNWNNFEGCFKFTHPDAAKPSTDRTRYYAGGADAYDTKELVMEHVCKDTYWIYEAVGEDKVCRDPGPFPVDTW